MALAVYSRDGQRFFLSTKTHLTLSIASLTFEQLLVWGATCPQLTGTPSPSSSPVFLQFSPRKSSKTSKPPLKQFREITADLGRRDDTAKKTGSHEGGTPRS